MSDLTVYAEALISAIARAFYEDDAVCLIDVLLRDKYLRDDDMGPRLSLPAKQLRRTLQFLQDEFLVKYELVDDLSSGGSQATKFWYVDYNHAVNVIRLRIYMLRKKLEEAELRARSSSMYLCPGYAKKTCNGRYTETEAQQIVDHSKGLFLCQECYKNHENNPEPPPLETYTLQLVDNTKDLRAAMDNIRRVNVQLSAKMVGNQQLRVGIYDLLQKVRVKGKGPLSSNLPSENRALGIGSKRLAGTGRTAGIKAKKLAQQGIVAPGGSGGLHRIIGEGATRSEEGSDLNFLKNARGEEIAFEVEKGGGARANLLAMRSRRKSKLMDAAASRVGVRRNGLKRKRATIKEEKGKDKKVSKGLPFLYNNIGRKNDEQEEESKRKVVDEEENEEDDDEDNSENEDEFSGMTEEERQKAFQTQYKIEMSRQRALLEDLAGNACVSDAVMTNGTNMNPPRTVSDDNGADGEDENGVTWEDG